MVRAGVEALERLFLHTQGLQLHVQRAKALNEAVLVLLLDNGVSAALQFGMGALELGQAAPDVAQVHVGVAQLALKTLLWAATVATEAPSHDAPPQWGLTRGSRRRRGTARQLGNGLGEEAVGFTHAVHERRVFLAELPQLVAGRGFRPVAVPVVAWSHARAVIEPLRRVRRPIGAVGAVSAVGAVGAVGAVEAVVAVGSVGSVEAVVAVASVASVVAVGAVGAVGGFWLPCSRHIV